MKKVRLIDFHEVSPVRSQTVYHAAGYALTEESPDTIILVSSNQPYVCIGYHQDLEKEVDLDYCQAHSLPAELDILARQVHATLADPDGGVEGVKAQSAEITAFLRKWLVDHVMKADMQLVPLFRKPVVR